MKEVVEADAHHREQTNCRGLGSRKRRIRSGPRLSLLLRDPNPTRSLAVGSDGLARHAASHSATRGGRAAQRRKLSDIKCI